MVPYLPERFTPDEQDVLRRYFTNLDRPVFALVNLPEVVKGALFARYSRSPKSLRRLFLDEFVGELDIRGDATVDATVGLSRAEDLYSRVFVEYGDDSVAQLGGVHLACEQASNLLTKILERGRLMAYLEQSTRYIAYDNRLPNGHYRYHRPSDVLDSPLGARYVGDMDRLYDTYADLLARVHADLQARHPKQPGDSDLVHRQAVRAKALDATRGLLPAAALSNVGMYGTGQSYELLLVRMRAHPLPEARHYADLMLEELRKVIPSFIQRVDRADRGVVWSEYFASNRQRTAAVVDRLVGRSAPVSGRGGGEREGRGGEGVASGERGESDGVRLGGGARETEGRSEVRLVDFDPDGERKVIAAICYAYSDAPEDELVRRVDLLGADERRAILAAYVGERTNRRHRPGRAFERTGYRFDLLTDYGAFRDLQRHRMATVEWQDLGPTHGFAVPEEIVDAGLDEAYRSSLERSAALHDALVDAFPVAAPYAVALAFRIRYVIQCNAREAMHLIELRSGTQGHPSYRSVAHQMHRLIAEQAGHRLIAEAMCFVDHQADALGRLDGERRSQERRVASGAGEIR